MRSLSIAFRLWLGLTCFCSSLPITWAESSENKDITEIQQVQNQNNATYGALNRLNTLSDQSGAPLSQDPNVPVTSPGLEQIEKFLSSPPGQALMKFFSSPHYSALSDQILKNPNKAQLWYAQIGWFVFFLIFRAWRASRLDPDQWIRKIFLYLWTMVVFVAVSVSLIPWLILGDPYIQVLIGVAKAIFS